ncbi:MAG: FMN-binding protein [Pirellulaceae bacterium]|nr:FMN-binding protein [Pirellulaceae bacterium]
MTAPGQEKSPNTFLLVLLLAGTLGGALALVERSLEGRIANHARSRLRAAVLDVVPGGHDSQAVDLAGQPAYRVIDNRQQTVGWAVPATTTGFADRLELMIGLSADGQRITGLLVLESKETPGLGDRIRDPQFTGQFVGQPADAALQAVKPGGSAEFPIQAVTGATISSRAVTDGVRETLRRVRAAIQSAAESAPASPDAREPTP